MKPLTEKDEIEEVRKAARIQNEKLQLSVDLAVKAKQAAENKLEELKQAAKLSELQGALTQANQTIKHLTKRLLNAQRNY